jgi:hypothetical protein
MKNSIINTVKIHSYLIFEEGNSDDNRLEFVTRENGRISFRHKHFNRWFHVSENSFKKIFNLKSIPENHLPVFKCQRCIGNWVKDNGTIGDRANRIFLSWLPD